MSLRAEISPGDSDTLNVSIPPTRPDILHECDIMEDAAIAYGFNNLPDTFPATSTVAQPLAVSKLSDIIRHEWAYAGWVEVLPLILVRVCTHPTTASAFPNMLSLAFPRFPSNVASAPTRKTFLGSRRPTMAKRQSRSPTPRRSSSRWCARRSCQAY